MINARTLLRRFLAPPLRLEMVRTAQRAPRLLGESAALVRKYILRKQNADGGFPDRAGHSDLYYTVFGLQSLLALEEPFSGKPMDAYLASFGDGSGLDFVHLCCLARCRALLGGKEKTSVLAGRIETHRTSDGGYHPTPGQPHGTAYAAFLALGAYQDLDCKLPNQAGLANALRLLATADGAWANERPAKIASTNATAAAIAALGNIQPQAIPRKVGRWLLAQAHPLGGFRASPLASLPDLLSTATALHTIRALGLPVDAAIRESCLDFIDTLWSNEGGFHGQWHDDILDVEYTFYGLLALGCLVK